MGFAIAADAAGNSYITGNFFSPIASFGGGISLTNAGENDVLVAKYDPSGNPLWARQVKGISDDFGYGIAVDPAGNSYVSGTFLSSLATFATGMTLTNGGYSDIFMVKYNPAGTALWAKKGGRKFRRLCVRHNPGRKYQSLLERKFLQHECEF